MGDVFVTLSAQYRPDDGTYLFKWVCVWPQRRPGSLTTDAGGPKGVLGISGNVGSRMRVLNV